MYGLIGYPLGHSFSMKYFTEKFDREGIVSDYELFPIPDITDLTRLIGAYPDLRGLNVTIPYKESVLQFCSYISDEVREIGATNTLKIDRDGSIQAYNTDYIGFRKSVEPLLKKMKHVEAALILGTGGAAKAIHYALQSLGIKTTFVSRTPQDGDLGYDQLDRNVIAENKLIVNCTPLGTWPHTDECPPIPYQYLDESHICHDLVYNPPVTKFMNMSAQFGAMVKNGYDMLIFQAEESWKVWKGM